MTQGTTHFTFHASPFVLEQCASVLNDFRFHVGIEVVQDLVCEFLGSEGQMALTWSEAILLKNAIFHAKPNADLEKLSAAMGDFIVVQEEQQKLRRENEPQVRSANEAEIEEERFNKKRDDIFRDIFLGGSQKRVNIWGNVVDETPDLELDLMDKLSRQWYERLPDPVIPIYLRECL